MLAASWIAPYGNCQTTCGRCPAGCQWPTQPACPCRNVAPPVKASAAAGQTCQGLVSTPVVQTQSCTAQDARPHYSPLLSSTRKPGSESWSVQNS